MAVVWTGNINTGVTQVSSSVETHGASHAMLMIKSDKALTLTIRVSPLSSERDRNPDGSAATISATTDWYPLGSTIAVVANTPLAQQITIGGAEMTRVDINNASGSTAAVTAYLTPTITQIGR